MKPKPNDEEKLISLQRYKRLMSKKGQKAKNARTLAIVLRIVGGIMLIGTVSVWGSKFSLIPTTRLALLAGVILAATFKLANPDGLNTNNKIHKGIVLFFIVVPTILMMNQPTAPYSIMFLFGLVSAVYLFGVVKTLPGLEP
jgi:hypothetical protein